MGWLLFIFKKKERNITIYDFLQDEEEVEEKRKIGKVGENEVKTNVVKAR